MANCRQIDWGFPREREPGMIFLFFLNNTNFIYLFTFGCAVSLLLHTQAFSSCRERGLLLVAQASHCCAVSCCRARAPGVQAPGVAAHGPSSGGWAQLPCGMWDSPDQGSNPCPCIGRQILYHCTIRKALLHGFKHTRGISIQCSCSYWCLDGLFVMTSLKFLAIWYDWGSSLFPAPESNTLIYFLTCFIPQYAYSFKIISTLPLKVFKAFCSSYCSYGVFY